MSHLTEEPVRNSANEVLLAGEASHVRRPTGDVLRVGQHVKEIADRHLGFYPNRSVPDAHQPNKLAGMEIPFAGLVDGRYYIEFAGSLNVSGFLRRENDLPYPPVLVEAGVRVVV